ncbi:MAG: PadR family transcriptional regulator [Candidatus Sericytochromatia bacterium]
MKQLSTTSYAILGQLALREWSAYELASEMQRNIHYFWPRAESGIYAELKRLTQMDLAQAEKCFVGKRSRTLYQITEAGHGALQDWLASPPAPLSLEFESLLRVLYASLGTPEQLQASISVAQTEAEELLRLASKIGQEYLNGRAPFQGQIAARCMIYDYLAHFAHFTKAWAVRSQQLVASWEGLDPEARAQKGRDLIEQDMRTLGIKPEIKPD